MFPESTQEVVALVKLAAEHGMPIVGRGAGTGLSGGAIARAGGMVISFARMNRILEIDLANERAVVQPGVVNIDITEAVEADGYFFAPDPSSQRACTIGGNVSENSGRSAYPGIRRHDESCSGDRSRAAGRIGPEQPDLDTISPDTI